MSSIVHLHFWSYPQALEKVIHMRCPLGFYQRLVIHADPKIFV